MADFPSACLLINRASSVYYLVQSYLHADENLITVYLC